MARIRTRSSDQDDRDEQKAATVSDRRRRLQRDASEEENGNPARKDRPTPSMRQQTKTRGSSGLINRIPVVRSVVAYFRGVASEMQKVTWPSREEATRLTYVVLAVTIAFAVTLGLIDAFLGWWFRQAFHANTEDVFLIVAAAVAVILGGGYTLFRDKI